MSVWTPPRALAERIYSWLEEREHRALTGTGEQVVSRLYRVRVKGGGSFLYDTVDVGRFMLAMAEHRDNRPVTVRPVGPFTRLRWRAENRGVRRGRHGRRPRQKGTP